MPVVRTLRHLRVGPVHSRPGTPSHIELSLLLEGVKTDRLDVYTITEDQALDLAQEALHAALVIRNLRVSRAEFDRIERADREAQA